MKTIYLTLAVMLMTACHNNQPDKNTADHSSDGSARELTATVSSSAEEDDNMTEGTSLDEKGHGNQAEVDGVTGATAVANPASFNGTLMIPPQRLATISLPMDGIVKELPLLSGSYVQKGALIATLSHPDFVELQQTYVESHAQAEYLEAEYQRQLKLSQQEVASQKRLQESKAEYLAMQSRMEASRARLQQLGVEAEGLTADHISALLPIKAPISGYLAGLEVNVGSYLHAGDPLCQIIDKNQLMLRLIAYEKDLKDIQVGYHLKFYVNGLGDKEFHATIVSIGQQVDKANRSIELYAKVNESHPQFRPGMYVSARVVQ